MKIYLSFDIDLNKMTHIDVNQPDSSVWHINILEGISIMYSAVVKIGRYTIMEEKMRKTVIIHHIVFELHCSPPQSR